MPEAPPPPTVQSIENSQIRLERLRSRRQFLYVAAGLADRRRHVVIQARTRPHPPSCGTASCGVGFTSTRKIGGAVVRNRARRRLREAARLFLPQLGLASVDYVFIARQETADCPWPRLLDDVQSALISLRRRLTDGETPRPPRSQAKD